jgi:hypothetical protein
LLALAGGFDNRAVGIYTAAAMVDEVTKLTNVIYINLAHINNIHLLFNIAIFNPKTRFETLFADNANKASVVLNLETYPPLPGECILIFMDYGNSV